MISFAPTATYGLSFLTADNLDFTGQTIDFTYDSSNAGSRLCFVVPITDDMVVENREFFTCQLTSSDPSVDLHPDEAEAVIDDDDG